MSWPALDRAAALVIEEAADLAGIFHDILTPAADALAARHLLASTLVLRAMIDFTLSESRPATNMLPATCWNVPASPRPSRTSEPSRPTKPTKPGSGASTIANRLSGT